MRSAPVFALLTLLILAPSIALGQAYGRLFGTVVDGEGQPLEDVQVTIVVTGSDAKFETTTNAKGKFKLGVPDATKVLTLRLIKEGYQERAEEVKIPIGQVVQGQWGMVKEGTGADIALPSKVEGERKAVEVFNEGVKAFNEGDKPTALLKFEEARSLDPAIKEVYEVLTTLYLEANRIADAKVSTEALLALDPNNRVGLEAQFTLAETSGNREEASRLADLLIEQYPGESVSLIAFNAAVLATRANDLPAAERYFNASLGMNPTLVPAKVGLVRVLHALGKADEALAMADQVIEAEPDSATAWTIRYEIYKARGEKAKADEAYAKVFSANPDQAAQVMYEDGKQAWDDGNVDRAVAVLTRLLELSPDHPRAHYFLGLAAVSSGKTAEAKRLFARFIELAPDDSEAGTAREMIKAL